MDYARIYREFISDRMAKQPEAPTYFERHHILPRSLGGGNEPENLIKLTAEDHIHAHILLAKIHGGKMWAAAMFMTKRTVGRTRSVKRIPTGAEIRAAAFAKRMLSKHCRGENHPMYGRTHTASARARMKAAQILRAERGEFWSQKNPHLISGKNHWTKNPAHAASVLKSADKWKASLRIASAANTGDKNVMHRPEVADKVRQALLRHHAEGTGPASPDSRAKLLAAHRTADYLAGARDRVLGAKNPSFGLTAGKNPNSRKVICIETGVVFDSVKDAVAFCGGDVTKAARTGGKAGGYTWRRVGQHSCDGRVTKREK